MRHTAAAIAVVVVALAAIGLSRHLLQASAGEGADYTASTDFTLAVPAIDGGAGWQTVLHIQNTGDNATSARLEFFGTGAVECPAARQPLAVHCVGPIPAGAVQTLDVSSDPTLAEARSALVMSAQPDDGGCSTSPGEPLALVVRRTQVSGEDEPTIATGSYVGIAPAVAGFRDAAQKAYVTTVPWVDVSETDQTTLHLQNIGLSCTDEVKIVVLSGLDCLPMAGTLPAMPPGRSVTVNLADLFAGDLGGSAWIRASQPLAVVVDRRPEGGALLTTHATGRLTAHQAVDAPLGLQAASGWRTTLRVQNASPGFTARIEAVYRTSEISPTREIQRVVCPGGSVPIDTAEVAGLALPFTGTVALSSVALGADQPELPPLGADIDLLLAGAGAAYHAPNRITDTLRAPDIALPWLTREYHPLAAPLSLTYTTQIAVVNQSQAAEGFISLTFYDPDGAITTYQPESPLGPRAMRIVDLAEIAVLPAGWHGSARLQFLSLEPGAGVAVAVLESATGAGGDTLAGYAGIVSRVQAQPTPTPSPVATATLTPPPALTPTATPPAPAGAVYFPLHRR